MKNLFFIPALAILTAISVGIFTTSDTQAREYYRHIDDDRDDRYYHDRDDWDDRYDWNDRDDRDDDDVRKDRRWNVGHGKVEHRIPPGHRVKTFVRYRGDDHNRYKHKDMRRKHRSVYDRYGDNRYPDHRFRYHGHSNIRAEHENGFPFPGLNLFYDSYHRY